MQDDDPREFAGERSEEELDEDAVWQEKLRSESEWHGSNMPCVLLAAAAELLVQVARCGACQTLGTPQRNLKRINNSRGNPQRLSFRELQRSGQQGRTPR